MGRMTLHAAWRALALVFLGVFLRSIDRRQTYWTFEDTLSQIGLGYFFLFLLGFRSRKEQWFALAILAFGYWAAFALYPLPGPDFKYPEVGVPDNWPHLMHGFSAHWNKNSNLAWALDVWFLILFPREKPFVFNGGGYPTLSFVPTLGTMVLGLLAGGILRDARPAGEKLKWLGVAGLIGLGAGALLGGLRICPVVKRIWTPAWVLYSGGWCFLLLAIFYYLIDVRCWKNWAFPLVVIGMNSIAAYSIAHLFEEFTRESLRIHFGTGMFDILGQNLELLLQGAAVLLVYWLILFWMYRCKIFLRI